VKELGEGLGYCVAGDLGVAGECVDGAPESLGVGTIYGLDAFARFQHGRCAFHR